jgi:pimeloyl-ACP methyl ester carboxylesterase
MNVIRSTHHLRLAAVVTAATALLSLSIASAATAAVATGPSGNSFYTPAASTYKSGSPGDLIWKRSAQSAIALSNASQSVNVIYKSKSLDNKLIPVSGTVYLPKGTPPSGGWPIVSYAHGTTGSADICAPSRFADANSPNYISYVYPTLNTWLSKGYAVAATDYEGLGTPGVHPWLIGPSEAHGVIDIAKAAQKLDSHVSGNLVIAGHSQGGHAALWAGSLTNSYGGSSLKLKGVVAFAPANNMKTTVVFAAGALSAPNGISGLGALLVRSTTQADTTLKLSDLMNSAPLAKMGDLETRCISPWTLANGTTPNPTSLGATSSFGQFSPQQLLKGWSSSAKNWTDPKVVKALNALDGPKISDSTLSISAPVLLLQGAVDGTVLAFTTQALQRTLGVANGDSWKKTNGAWAPSCGASCKVQYKEFAGIDHGPIVISGEPDATAFMRAKFGR